MNETGPEATPIVERTTSFFGRRREKANPVPPPDCAMSAITFSATDRSPPDWCTSAIARRVS